jgi:protein-S-isoprenylcysteine O-methyltransferase Ste14
VHWPKSDSVAAFPIIVLSYTLLTRKEERQMLEKFSDDHCEYQLR